MIVYFLAPTVAQGVADAQSRGWKGIARTRFITETRDDVRVIHRFAELVPISNGTMLAKSADYETGPFKRQNADERLEAERAEAWERERADFEAFVASGAGRWVEP